MKKLNSDFNWIKNITIIDDLTIDVNIDINPDTAGDQYYNLNYFERLSIPILPEHYLNQSQLLDGQSPDTSHESWEKFAKSCFGTGLFELTSYEPGVETTLNTFTNSWHIDDTITSDEDLNWEQRFGDYSGDLNQLRIKQFLNKKIEEYEYKSGKIDLFEFSSLLDIDKQRDEFLAYPYVEIQHKLANSISILGFNMRENRAMIGSLEDCQVITGKSKGLAIRKAISYAINRQEIQRIIFGLDKEITTGPLHPLMGLWRNPDMIKYCCNLDVARRFLTIAGFDLSWCGQPQGSYEWPDWETLCSGEIPTSIQTTISVNGLGTIFLFSFLLCLSGIFLIKNKLLSRVKK